MIDMFRDWLDYTEPLKRQCYKTIIFRLFTCQSINSSNVLTQHYYYYCYHLF